MALVKCKECSAQIAKSADICPQCGAKQQRYSLISKILLGLVVFVVVINIFLPNQGREEVVSTGENLKKPIKPDLEKLSSNFDSQLKAANWSVARNTAQKIIDNYPDSEKAKSAAAAIPEIEAKIELARKEVEAERKDKIQKALHGLYKKRDDVNGITFYSAPESPRSIANYWSLYIGVPDQGFPYLRFTFMYTADNWLFIEGITLNVDGEKLPDAPIGHFSVKRDNSGGRIWEWYDEGVKEKDIPLFEKLISSKKTIIRYNGDKYYYDQILSDRDKRAMRKVLDAYRLLSGSNA